MVELVLRELQGGDREALCMAVEEFRHSDPGWMFAFHFDPNADFDAYVRQVANWKRGRDMPTPFVPNTFLVGVVGAKIVGRLSLRHELNDALRQDGGHVGYGVVASERGKGYARRLLELSLPLARAVGLPRIMLSCDDDNLPSSRTIEACGGVLQDRVSSGRGVLKRRYWIEL
ncbi:MAG: GNAT family N-acetyltransferase [Myxococcales bacterium]|nr:GNAT family N-acetyltransferase [Myxococcales bacterium]